MTLECPFCPVAQFINLHISLNMTRCAMLCAIMQLLIDRFRWRKKNMHSAFQRSSDWGMIVFVCFVCCFFFFENTIRMRFEAQFSLILSLFLMSCSWTTNQYTNDHVVNLMRTFFIWDDWKWMHSFDIVQKIIVIISRKKMVATWFKLSAIKLVLIVEMAWNQTMYGFAIKSEC